MSRRDKKKSTKEKQTIAMMMGGDYLPHSNVIVVGSATEPAKWYCATRLAELTREQAVGRARRCKPRKGVGGWNPHR